MQEHLGKFGGGGGEGKLEVQELLGSSRALGVKKGL